MYTAVLMLAMVSGAESIDHGRSGCSGCYGCYGSCYGYAYSGCRGCYGCYGCYGYTHTRSYYGCCGCYGYSSAPVYYRAAATPVYYGGVVASAVPTAVPATIVINLPANARVTFNGARTNSSGEVRTYVTPALERGTTYSYTIQAEINSGGQTAVQSRDVIVRAGETSTVRFDMSPEGVTAR